MVATVVRFFYPYVWVSILKSITGQKIHNWPKLYYIYAKSWLGRYLPGKVTWIIGKVVFAREQGIKSDVLVVSSILEIVAQVISSFSVGILFITLGSIGKNSSQIIEGQPSEYELIGLIIAAALFFVALAPLAVNKMVKLAYKLKYKKNIKTTQLDRKTVILSLGYFTVLALLNTIPLYLFFYALADTFSISDYLYASGAFLLAGVLGLVAIFAPSGLGVREGSLIFLLNNRYSTEISVLVAVVLRIWSIVVDLSFFATAFMLDRYHRNPKETKD